MSADAAIMVLILPFHLSSCCAAELWPTACLFAAFPDALCRPELVGICKEAQNHHPAD